MLYSLQMLATCLAKESALLLQAAYATEQVLAECSSSGFDDAPYVMNVFHGSHFKISLGLTVGTTCRSLVIRLVHNNASATFPIKHQARFVIGQCSNTTKVLTATHVKVNLPVKSLLKFLQVL